jgi:tRNA threonylcarbamoyladenosine biosynthesis protein TsaE
MEIVFTLEDIDATAKQFLQMCSGHKVFAFAGDLGAGKTTFINSLCKVLGVEENITSPTYSIIQEYLSKNNNIIYHIDLYRIKSRMEAMEAGIEDCLNSKEFCMVEWPERVPDILPDNTVFTSIEILSANERKLIITLPR